MLSKKTKYGIKALTFCAPRKSDPCCFIADVQKRKISVKFLESILLLLRHSGFGC
jgi:DNA-binding IscR family transcriptional regulator